jgi:uncharacterized protein YdcH (DUF465 family)
MTITLLTVLCILAAIAGAVYWKASRSADAASSEDGAPAAVDETQQRENAIVELNLTARRYGLQLTTDIEPLLDECVRLHEAISGVDGAEQSQLHSAPADFTRLLNKHLPELISKFAQAGVADDTSVEALNKVLAQLKGEITGLIEQIHNRNFDAFARKNRFVEIRYSDQY